MEPARESGLSGGHHWGREGAGLVGDTGGEAQEPTPGVGAGRGYRAAEKHPGRQETRCIGLGTETLRQETVITQHLPGPRGVSEASQEAGLGGETE